jgi:hypothetical protein
MFPPSRRDLPTSTVESCLTAFRRLPDFVLLDFRNVHRYVGSPCCRTSWYPWHRANHVHVFLSAPYCRPTTVTFANSNSNSFERDSSPSESTYLRSVRLIRSRLPSLMESSAGPPSYRLPGNRVRLRRRRAVGLRFRYWLPPTSLRTAAGEKRVRQQLSVVRF